MDIVNSILSVGSNIGNWFTSLINTFTNIFSPIIQALWYVLSILKALWYGLTSILTWLWNLIVEVFNSGVFVNVNSAFIKLWDYIWGPAVVFIATMLFLIIFRIWLAFVFKIFRLNIDYHSLQSKTRTWNQHTALDSQKKSLFE